MLEFLKYNPPDKNPKFDLTFGAKDIKYDNIPTEYKVSTSIDDNLCYARKLMHTELSGDIIIRVFNWNVNSKSIKAFIIYADGIVNKNSINQFVLQPAMQNREAPKNTDMLKFFSESVMPQSQVEYSETVNKITDAVNFGNAGIFVDGFSKGMIIDIKTWEHRNIGTPINETVVQGPHEGFNEILRCNTALIRKSVNNSNLVFETFQFGKKSKTPASLAYIDGIINPDLKEEIKKKLLSFEDDYIFSVFDIEKGIEESNNISIPQVITSERPDKVCRSLVEGRAALLLNGSSHALILPSNITDIISSPEDAYLRKPYSVFIKLIRIIAVFLSLLTPGLFIAITRFHTESLLSDMFLSLINERYAIPFSLLTEILIMEVSFELIKEAGIRVPGSIGSSLGIVGGLILGQSAVNAGLVSPITIIIVSIC
ncbi:MAG: spore germination protein, partial [Clostridia bacterium]|nr:spore germination protein [Clostridia bacterium]